MLAAMMVGTVQVALATAQTAAPGAPAEQLQLHAVEQLLIEETKHAPVFYLPRSDVRMGLLERTDHSTYCPFKGHARYWSLTVQGRTAKDALWCYEEPFEEVRSIAGYVAFYWDRVDAWRRDGEPMELPG